MLDARRRKERQMSATGFKIKVSKKVLLQEIMHNRHQHDNSSKKALQIYKQQAEQALRNRLNDIESSNIEPEKYLLFDMQCPVSYVEQYDRIIDMLNMSTDTEITLSEEQFRQWVEDNWYWKKAWKKVSGSYLKY